MSFFFLVKQRKKKEFPCHPHRVKKYFSAKNIVPSIRARDCEMFFIASSPSGTRVVDETKEAFFAAVKMGGDGGRRGPGRNTRARSPS